jgi:hypothetical protein
MNCKARAPMGRRCCIGLGLLCSFIVQAGCNSGDAGATKPTANVSVESASSTKADGKASRPDTSSRREIHKQRELERKK